MSDNNINKEITESSLSRLYSKFGKENIGMISAFRAGEHTEAENKVRSRALQAKMVTAGFDVTKVFGQYIEHYDTPNARNVVEESYFVVETESTRGKLLDFLIKEAKVYNQDSIYFKPLEEDGYLLGVSERSDSYPSYEAKVKCDLPVFGKEGLFFTKVRNRPFTMNVAEHIQPPKGYFANWAMHGIANKK